MIENNVELADRLQALTTDWFEDEVVKNLADQMRIEIDREILLKLKRFVFSHT